MCPIKEIERFVSERQLNQMEFSKVDYGANVLEELFELYGYHVPKELRGALKVAIDELIFQFANTVGLEKLDQEHHEADALADIIVFSIDGLMRLGYDPSITLEEVAKEINSREGKIIDGKFQKYTDEVHRSKWYKADLEAAKL